MVPFEGFVDEYYRSRLLERNKARYLPFLYVLKLLLQY